MDLPDLLEPPWPGFWEAGMEGPRDALPSSSLPPIDFPAGTRRLRGYLGLIFGCKSLNLPRRAGEVPPNAFT